MGLRSALSNVLVPERLARSPVCPPTDTTSSLEVMATIMLGRCTMRVASITRRAGLSPTSMVGSCSGRELSASANLSTKQQMEGFTVKDRRAPRPRVAKEKRRKYLAERKASFEVEQQKANSLGLDWGIRSAL